MGQVTISLNSRKGTVRQSTYAHTWTLADLQAGNVVPAGFWAAITALQNAFTGGVTLSDGTFRKTSVSFDSQDENRDVPNVQTHEEKVILVGELYNGAPFPNKLWSVSIPMPDLGDFAFPQGTDRIMADDFDPQVSVNGRAWISNTVAFYLAHNNPMNQWGSCRPLYIDLNGTSV